MRILGTGKDFGMQLPDGHNEPSDGESQLNQAIDANDLARVDQLLTANPELRQVLIDDVPLQRVAQPGRIPMMDLLVRHGADVNGLCWGWFPALFTPCENLEPEPLQWLLDHGADPNRGNPNDPGTALDYVIQTYPRDPKRLTTCIEILLAAEADTRYDVPGVLPILRGRTGELVTERKISDPVAAASARSDTSSRDLAIQCLASAVDIGKSLPIASQDEPGCEGRLLLLSAPRP